MKKLIVLINELSLYAVVFSSLFLIQKYTIGKIKGFKDIIVFEKFYLHELLFIVSSILIIIKFVDVKSNYKTVKKT